MDSMICTLFLKIVSCYNHLIAKTKNDTERGAAIMNLTYNHTVAAIAECRRSSISHWENEQLVHELGKLGKSILRKKFSCESFSCSETKLLFLIHCNPYQTRLINQYEIYSLLEEFQIEARNFFDAFVSIGIGDCQESAEGLDKSYQQAQAALEHQFYLNRQTILSFLDVTEKKTTDTSGEIQNCFDCLYQHLSAKNGKALTETIDSYFAQLEQQKHIAPSLLKRKIIEFLLKLYKEQHIKEEAHLLDLIEQVNTAENLSVLYSLFTALLQEIQSRGQDGSAHLQNEIERVKHYINCNYAEPISLKQIADSLFISQSYLSSLFKSVTGIHFNEYLTMVRIEKAKELLQYSGYRVYEVCELVGYRDKKYFTALFRRYTGVLPKDWAREQKVS